VKHPVKNKRLYAVDEIKEQKFHIIDKQKVIIILVTVLNISYGTEPAWRSCLVSSLIS